MAERCAWGPPEKNWIFWNIIRKNEVARKIIKINLKSIAKDTNVKEILINIKIRKGKNKKITVVIRLKTKKINRIRDVSSYSIIKKKPLNIFSFTKNWSWGINENTNEGKYA